MFNLTRCLSCLVMLVLGMAIAPAYGQIPEFYPDGSPFQAGRPPLKERPVGDAAIIRTMADAMGFIRFFGPRETTDTINRLLWRGAGTMVENGMTYQISQYTYNTGLLTNAAREDIMRTDAKGNDSRIVRVVVGDMAWDETAPGIGGKAAPGQSKPRLLRHARTPFGFTRFVLKAAPGTVKVMDPGPNGKVTVSVPVQGVLTTATLNPHYRPESIVQTLNGKTYEALYTDYKDVSEYGVMFATHITEKVAGKLSMELTIDDGRVSSYAVFPKPDGVKADR
jgi:hypothetical protein